MALKKNNKKNRNALQTSAKNMVMDVEFGSEFVEAEAQRAARAVQTRVKNTAQRYGFQSEE